jgi:hypothetical protein
MRRNLSASFDVHCGLRNPPVTYYAMIALGYRAYITVQTAKDR